MQFYNGTAWKNFVNIVPVITVDYLVVAGGGGGVYSTNPGGGAGGFPVITVDYLVVAGGGGGVYSTNPGGGAGGLRTSYGSTSGGGASAEPSLNVASGTSITVTVGAGGPNINASI
jgi:hypothetical protein